MFKKTFPTSLVLVFAFLALAIGILKYFTQPQNSPYLALYQEDNNLVGFTKEYKKVALRPIDGNLGIQGFSNDLQYLVLHDSLNKKSYLQTTEGEAVLDFDGYVFPISWLPDKGKVLVHHRIFHEDKEKYQVTTELWDIKQKILLKKFEDLNFTEMHLLYNGDILTQQILEERTENQNVELIVYDQESFEPKSIGKYKVGSASSISQISNDRKKLAMSNQNNLHIYNFIDGSFTQMTNYPYDELSNTMAFMRWSPNDEYIAFQTQGDKLFSNKIGIINLNNKQTEYVTEKNVLNTINRPGIRVVVLSPAHWKNNINVYLKLEASEKPEVKKVYEYFEYNLKTKELNAIPAFSGKRSLDFL